jgi:membrane-associated protein
MLDPFSLLPVLGPWMLAVVALFVFIESGVLFPFLPGDSLLVAAAILAPQMGISRVVLAAVAVVAAFLGDQVGFWLGRRFGRRLFRGDARVLSTARLRATEQFFDTYGAAALVLGRFVPIVRTFVPVVAGISKLHYRRFVLWNAIGATSWAAGLVLVGSLVGNIPFVRNNIDVLAVAVIIVSILPIVIGWLRTDSGRSAAGRGWRWLIAGVPRALPRPGRGVMSLAVAALAVCVGFGLLIAPLPHNAFDAGIAQTIDAWRGGPGDAVAIAIEHLFGPPLIIVPVVLLMAAYGWRRRSLPAAVFAGGMVVLPWAVAYLLKFVVDRPRPTAGVFHLFPAGADPSFPSGHTAAAAALAVFLVAWAWRTRLRWPVLAAAVALVGAVCCSRVYAGAHYPTDTIGSVVAVLAVAVLLLGIAAWMRDRTFRPRPGARSLEPAAAEDTAEPAPAAAASTDPSTELRV